jgi:hypothetical protein
MANVVFNVAKGRVVELYDRVKANDPSTARLVLIPIETTGLETDATLIDAATVAAVLAGATNEQTTMGRKYLTDADLAATTAPDNTNNRRRLSLPTVSWTSAAGNPISKIVVAYDANSGADSALVPMTMFDFAQTPTGATIVMNSGEFYEAA